VTVEVQTFIVLIQSDFLCPDSALTLPVWLTLV
jgi:hypothetical protein